MPRSILSSMESGTPTDAGRRRLTRVEARQQTRERLLDAAADVFKRLGYHGATLEAVAEAAGYTKGAVYSNFATKADLFMALLDRYVEGEITAQLEQFAGKTLEQVLDEIEVVFDRQVRSDPQWATLRMEFWLVADRDPEVRQRMVAKSEEYRDRAGAMIDAMLAAEGRTAPFTGRELGMLINALASGAALEIQHDPKAIDTALLVRGLRQLVGLPAGGGDGHARGVDQRPS